MALDKAAVPPATDNEKSLASMAPLPFIVLNTASLRVTATVPLSPATTTEEIVGGNSSFNVAVLFDWVVLASFPAPS